MAQFLTHEALQTLASGGVRHGFFTRRGGVSEGIYAALNTGLGSRDDVANVRENRRRAMAALGAERLATPYQRHTDICAVIEDVNDWTSDNPPVADAIATNVEGLMVAVNTADCGPILFADAKARVVAAAHAGWRGAIGGVLESTIEAMEALGAQRKNVVAVVGPCISRRAYEVDEAFRQRFLEESAENARFFAPGERAGHVMFDLPGYVARRLRRAGLGEVHDVARCTHGEEELFFSFRRTCQRGEPDYGRQLSAIMLMP